MVNKIREHVEHLFQDAPRSPRAVELKEELIANLVDRYNDLIQREETEETAYNVVIAGIGDVDELIRSLREQEVFDPMHIQAQRQKSAVFISIAVCLYIVSFIFPIIFSFTLRNTLGNVIGPVLMFLCWGAATALLVYNAMTKPKYVKMEETIVEDFKEWKVESTQKKSMYGAIQGMVWMVAVLLFMCLGIFFNAWHPGWLVFILAPVVNQIIHLTNIYRGDR